MEADALATAFMVMGAEKSLILANEHDLPVLLIVRSKSGFSQQLSSSMKEFIAQEPRI